jgi:DNA mismatch repair protein MutS
MSRLYKIEMNETSHIIARATPKSLIIMGSLILTQDEVGRGTSTKDGLSLALAILHHISLKNKSLCMFATHYHELAPMIAKYKIPFVKYSQAVSTLNSNDELSCLYKIEDGVMTNSHGIKIAENAGLPKSVIHFAQEIYKSL